MKKPETLARYKRAWKKAQKDELLYEVDENGYRLSM
jgi:hypothetical protein